MDKVSLVIKDDIFLADLMASLNPKPRELRKRLKSHKPVNRLKRKVNERLYKASQNVESGAPREREYARNN